MNMVQIQGDDDLVEIREAVAKLCANFPGEYWRKLDRESRYPTEFVAALTEAGYLAALIPEEYGGAGLPLRPPPASWRRSSRTAATARACHAQMYIMGTLLRHGSDEQKQRYLPRIASRRVAAAGFRRDRADQRHRHDLDQDIRPRARATDYVVNGQKIWTSRAEHSDLMLLLARTTPQDEVAKKTDGLSVFIVDMRRRAGDGTDHPADPHDDEPRAPPRSSSTTCEVPADATSIGEEGQGFRYILDGHERRAHPDRGRVHRRRQMVHREGDPPTPRSASSSAGRSARTRASSSRSPRPTPRCAPPT